MTTPLASMKNPEFKGSTASGGSRGSWPCFLGPNHDNISKESGLLTEWALQGPAPAWQLKGLGQGYSAVSVTDGIVFSMGTPETRNPCWPSVSSTVRPSGVFRQGGSALSREGHGNGPRRTPTVDGGSVLCGPIGRFDLRRHRQESGPLAQKPDAGVCGARSAIRLFGIRFDRWIEVDLHPGWTAGRRWQPSTKTRGRSLEVRGAVASRSGLRFADCRGCRRHARVYQRGQPWSRRRQGRWRFPLG